MTIKITACVDRLTPQILNNKTSLSLDPQKLQHMQYLLQFYEPKIVESIMKAETAIDSKHFENKKLNPIQFSPAYLNDLTKLDPYYDHLQKKQETYLGMTQPNPEDIPKGHNLENEEENNTDTSELKELAQRLSLATGFDSKYIEKLSVKTLILKTVRNQTAKGKISSFYALVCAGDRNGMLGIGEGKDPEEPATAVLKAHWQAVKNLTKIQRLENRTIYGQIENKYVSSIVHLRSAPPGSGLRCNPMIFELAQCAGIKDLSAKVYNSRNKMNVIKCTMDALTKQKTIDEIALERGKKVVDLRKIYYTV
ncbi:hypothetical protein CANARDRAFT_177912 [[Candida] arabinofermentans NRRL YB-2248]|uniref:Small ribosomal subunit protein uS5m n=1 Tax=[Candida] arabinofermentans NRRL YB-2248 TaxID=983967 RepID=A0A1E4SUD0_9ASCO|nr:hypothetical protein CANARDRAFT_177912 [[Candida] arabinofermentans NRRL YB-2248]